MQRRTPPLLPLPCRSGSRIPFRLPEAEVKVELHSPKIAEVEPLPFHKAEVEVYPPKAGVEAEVESQR